MRDADIASAKPAARIMVGRHYPELDGIRGIAILAVLVFHCRTVAEHVSPNGATSGYFAFASVGWMGVDLFFVLSGFLITGILLDTSAARRYFRNFYMRRVLRIFPLYYAAIGAVALAAAFTQFEPVRSPSPAAQVSYWLYLQNWLPPVDFTPILGHFWSLAIEEQFYLLWPALILLAVRWNAAGKLCVVTIATAVVVRIVLVKQDQRASYFVTFARLDALALGAGVAVLYRRLGSLAPLRRCAMIAAAVCVAALALVAYRRGGFYGQDRVVLAYGLLPLAALFAAFLVTSLTSAEDGALRRVLRSRALRFVGAISYGMYVFHWPVIVLLKTTWTDRSDAAANHLAFLAAAGAATVAVSWASFRFFESPILRLKSRFSSEPTAEAA